MREFHVIVQSKQGVTSGVEPAQDVQALEDRLIHQIEEGICQDYPRLDWIVVDKIEEVPSLVTHDILVRATWSDSASYFTDNFEVSITELNGKQSAPQERGSELVICTPDKSLYLSLEGDGDVTMEIVNHETEDSQIWTMDPEEQAQIINFLGGKR